MAADPIPVRFTSLLPFTRALPRVITLAGVIAYLALSLDHLTVFPPVGEDEPWIAAAPYKLATQGVYGSDLFAGYYGVDEHNYQHMPLYPLLQAGVFKVFGVGVLQMRLLPVAFGLSLLLVVLLVGRQSGDVRVGALAIVLMLGLRVAAGDDGTGILLLDRARINRYDIAVPVFGLLALWAFNRATLETSGPWYLATGVLTGMSSLSHLFGAFWLLLFLGLLLHRYAAGLSTARAALLVASGFVSTWLPWAAYVVSGWSDFVGQMRFVLPRLDVFNPSFYVSNVLHGGGPISLDWAMQTVRELPLGRPGTWTMLLGVPLAFVVTAWRARGGRHPAAWTLALASLAQLVMFVTLLKVKTNNYMIGIWPLGALLLAWLGVWLWDRRNRAVRILLLILLSLVLFEGGARVAHARTVARLAIPYDWFASEIARCIPAGSLVLGLQHYWLGLRQYPYRTWLMPANYANPLYYHAPLPLDEALERINPDVILIDRYMATFFESASNPDHPFHHVSTGFTAFVSRRRAEPICVILNRTYGAMTIYRVPPTSAAR